MAVVFATGSATYFMAPSVPTGWTQNTTNNNLGLRIVSGSTGGTVTPGSGFTTIHNPAVPFTGSAPVATGGVDGTSLSSSQIQPHTHCVPSTTRSLYSRFPSTLAFGVFPADTSQAAGFVPPGNPSTVAVGSTGTGATHSHTVCYKFSLAGSINFSVNYIDVILCTKN